MEIIKYGYVIFLQIIPLVSSGAITERERERFPFVRSEWRRSVRTTRGNLRIFPEVEVTRAEIFLNSRLVGTKVTM